ncbi:MAG: hypothetical protein ACKVN9_01820 [Methylophilaceae bacterium]
MKNTKLMLVDSDDYTSSILLKNLVNHGFENVQPVKNALELPSLLASQKPDIVIFNLQSNKPESLVICSTIKLISPQSSIVVIASPEALANLANQSADKIHIDQSLEKPLSLEHLFAAIENILKTKENSM